MEIAICDDLDIDARQLRDKIKDCADKYSISCNVFTYTDIYLFCSDVKNKDFDALFLDIVMPGANGIDLAREIRKTDKTIPVIFVTTERDFALEGYEVQAFDYVIKPAAAERIESILLRLNGAAKEYTVTIKQNRSNLNIPVDSIVYAESNRHNVLIHTVTDTYTAYMPFKAFTELLPKENSFFIYNRGAIVNFKSVASINGDNFTLKNGLQLHISRSKLSEMKMRYAEYVFKMTRG